MDHKNLIKAVLMVEDLMKMVKMPDTKSKEERKKLICMLIDIHFKFKKLRDKEA